MDSNRERYYTRSSVSNRATANTRGVTRSRPWNGDKKECGRNSRYNPRSCASNRGGRNTRDATRSRSREENVDNSEDEQDLDSGEDEQNMENVSPPRTNIVTIQEVKERIADVIDAAKVDHRKDFFCKYKLIYDTYVVDKSSKEEKDYIWLLKKNVNTQDAFENLNDTIKILMTKRNYREEYFEEDFPNHKEVFDNYDEYRTTMFERDLDRPGPSREYDFQKDYNVQSDIMEPEPFVPKIFQATMDRLKREVHVKITQLAELNKIVHNKSLNERNWRRKVNKAKKIARCKEIELEIYARLKFLNPFYSNSDSTDFSDDDMANNQSDQIG